MSARIEHSHSFGRPDRDGMRPKEGAPGIRILIFAPGMPADADLVVGDDGVDGLLQRCGPTTQLLAGEGEGVPFAPRRIEQFEPEHLVAEHPLFAEVREAGRRIAAVRPGTSAGSPGAAANLLPPSALKAWLDQLLASHVVPESAERDRARATLEAMTTALLRATLQDPGFRQLESLWLGLQWLLQQLPESVEVRLRNLPEHGLPRFTTADDGRTTFAAVLETYGALDRDMVLAMAGAAAAAGVVAFVDVAQDPRELDPARMKKDPTGGLLDALSSSADGHAIALCWPKILARAPLCASNGTPAPFGLDEVAESIGDAGLPLMPAAFAAVLRAARSSSGDHDPVLPDLPYALVDGPDGSPRRLLPPLVIPVRVDLADQLAERGLTVLASGPQLHQAQLRRLRTAVADPATDPLG